MCGQGRWSRTDIEKFVVVLRTSSKEISLIATTGSPLSYSVCNPTEQGEGDNNLVAEIEAMEEKRANDRGGASEQVRDQGESPNSEVSRRRGQRRWSQALYARTELRNEPAASMNQHPQRPNQRWRPIQL